MEIMPAVSLGSNQRIPKRGVFLASERAVEVVSAAFAYLVAEKVRRRSIVLASTIGLGIEERQVVLAGKLRIEWARRSPVSGPVAITEIASVGTASTSCRCRRIRGWLWRRHRFCEKASRSTASDVPAGTAVSCAIRSARCPAAAAPA